MAKSLSHLIEDVYEQKVLIQKAELYQLQAQINPHFLYNSFFILKSRIAAKKYEDASHFADMLGTYFKFIVKSNTGNQSGRRTGPCKNLCFHSGSPLQEPYPGQLG